MKNVPTTACPELDALIAEKVMGWTKLRKPPDESFQGIPFIKDGVTSTYQWVPTYSSGTTLTDSCGLVVEAMEKKGYYIDLRTCSYPHKYWVRFIRGAFTLGESEDVSAPLAICRAALLALNQSTGKE